MKKFLYIVFNIFAFGIPYIVQHKKARRISTKVNDALITTNKINFDIDTLIIALGNKENIVSISASTISTLKVILRDASNITKDSFNRFGTKGFIKNDNQIVLLFGDNANAISDAIRAKI